jgi:hypothetical protein
LAAGLGLVICKTRKLAVQVAVGLLLVFSFFYSKKTNLAKEPLYQHSLGHIDGYFLGFRPFTTYSAAARSWSENLGYKNLQEKLDIIITKDDCLVVSGSVDSLAARRYTTHRD